MGKNTSKCILIQNTKYPSNKCINTKYKILVPENVTKYNTCILYLKYRKYLFWIFHFLTIWYSRAFRFGLYNVHKALVNHTWLAWRCHTHNSSQIWVWYCSIGLWLWGVFQPNQEKKCLFAQLDRPTTNQSNVVCDVYTVALRAQRTAT